MALTLEQLQAKRDSVLAEMAKPHHVQFGDQSVTHRSAAELEAALARIDREITRLSNASRPRQVVITAKGY